MGQIEAEALQEARWRKTTDPEVARIVKHTVGVVGMNRSLDANEARLVADAAALALLLKERA